jgi:hypothetical protein
MLVKAALCQAANPYYRHSGWPQRDEIEFTIGPDSFRVWFTQASLQKPHEPTQREIVRARRGYLFPDYDEVPDERLGLALDGKGGNFWASSWRDTDDHRLDDDLAQVLEEIRLRHERLVEQREDEREREIARRRQEERDRVRAAEKYRREFLIDAMKIQAKRWQEADRLRRYAAAIREVVERLAADERDDALAWADQVEAEAVKTDPLPGAARVPGIPEPSCAELSPFMKPGSSSWGR